VYFIQYEKLIFDSSNAVLGMAFTPPPLEKAIAFCTAETNFVLHSKQNKKIEESHLKTSKVVKKGRKKSTQNLKKSRKSFRGIQRACTFWYFISAYNKLSQILTNSLSF
jgi:hypothetical protein